MKFSDHVKRLQRQYYHGKIDRPYAIVLLDDIMHEFRMLGKDEKLVDIPDDFGKFFEATGFLGEFTVQNLGSNFQWKRSYADRDGMQKVTLFTEPPPSSLAPQPQRRIAGEYRWHGPSGARKQVFVPVLNKQEQDFFAPYENDVLEGIALIQKEKA